MKASLKRLPLLLLLALPAVVYAQLSYMDNGDGTATITGCAQKYVGAVTIPGSTNGLLVTSIGSEAFWQCSLTSVTIPDSVTNIGDLAFSACFSLTSVVIGNSVTNIGPGTFQYCSSLTSVTIPDSVTSIEPETFQFCRSLTNVAVGNSVTNIGIYAFYECNSLTSVMIGDSVASIETGAFIDCFSLTSITIPDSVTSIGEMGFAGCTSLTKILIGNSVTNIGPGAFEFCTNLTTVTIPESVTSIGRAAFYYCANLTTITVDALNPVYSSVAGVLFDKSQATLIEYPGGIAGSYTIPNSVTTIGEGAFEDCSSLTSVTIPNSVTNIGDYAFEGCTSLTSITIPDSVTDIGSYTFYSCSSLSSVVIGDSVTSLAGQAFNWCTSLTNVTIGNSVTNMGDELFWECTSLTGVYFKGSAPSADSSVFHGDTNATVYYLPETTGWNPQVQTSDASFGVRTNQFGFTITGTSGLAVVVEACTNPANPAWSPVATNTLTGGSSYFSDPQWTNYPARFYRLSGLTFAGLPAVLWNPQAQTSDGNFGVRTNRFGFTITGTAGLVIVVEACANPANHSWSPVATNTLTGGWFYFSDPQWTNYPARFYRLRSP
jgi:hypothetical protein